MKGSRLADKIIQEQRREESFRKLVIRKECIINNKKQCDKCRYIDICENKETRAYKPSL